MTKQNINIIVYMALAVMVALQVKSCTDKTPPNAEIEVLKEQGKHKEEMRLKDSVFYTGQLQGKDSVIFSLLNRSVEKQVQYVQLKSDYGKIRPTVQSFDNSELLKRANGFILE